MLSANNNQVNFTAKFAITDVTKGLEHLQKAAKTAEAKTEKLPYDVYISGFLDDSCGIYAVNKKDGFEHCLNMSQEVFEKFLKLAPEELANKLVKLVKLFAKEDNENCEIIDFLRHFEKLKSAPREFFDNNYAKFADINAKETRIALDNDNIFKDADYVL